MITSVHTYLPCSFSLVVVLISVAQVTFSQSGRTAVNKSEIPGIQSSQTNNWSFKLHAYISSYAMFQRNQPIPIIGYGEPFEKVSIYWNDTLYSASASASGRLSYQLPAHAAGGPHKLSLVTKDTTITLSNILLGDVWFASGQSNMEWSIKKSAGGSQEMDNANFDQIRFLRAPKVMEFTANDDFPPPSSWVKANKAVADFSAVAWYFAKKIYTESTIPIGIIDASWGGTEIETWMSPSALSAFPYYQDELNRLQAMTIPLKELEQEAAVHFNEWKASRYKQGIGLTERWYERQEDLSDWKPIQVPGYWEDQLPEHADFDGEMWYRRTFDVPKNFLQYDIRMWLSQIDDHNMCWVNGQYIGETYFSKTWTNYLIPRGLLKESNNEIVLRVYDVEGKGGLTGLQSYFDFYPDGDNSVRGRLNGTWLVRAGSRFVNTYAVPISDSNVHPNHLPSLLFNGMVHPFQDFPITGVLWYQGEANKVNAFIYRELFPAMIADWRKVWRNYELPFYFVQIANYGPVNSSPEESASAELRESQTLAQNLPNTGMVVTLDIGDPNDIHPLNKRDVGERLARHALKNQYGYSTIVTDGPVYDSHIRKGNKLIITFRNVQKLSTNDNRPPYGFELAERNGKFLSANTRIKGTKIIVWHRAIKNPYEIRYAWAESPVINLYNEEGLPAYPFRTDQRKGLTEGQYINFK